jgi:KipI family sensor histidine kinase inhibitor
MTDLNASQGVSAVRQRGVGAHALLLEVDDPAGWYAELTRRRDRGELTVAEIVPGAHTVLLDGLDDPGATGELIRQWRLPETTDAGALPALVEVPVDFDGPDLQAVARHWDTDPDGVVGRLVQAEFHVAFCGFSPGWAYLAGLPLAVPRLPTPRSRVPAGSVGLADTYAGIYPTASPGGWQLVGRTDISLFDPDRDPPALLLPGTRVQLRQRAGT